MSNDNSLFHKLNMYAKSDAYSFHMPGHKRQAFFATTPESFDITEISDFDDLHHPEGILKEAQEQMAAVFGAYKSFFLVNGSTAGILTAICACTKKGGRILMARNCHKSVYHAALLQELSVDYIHPPVTEYGIAGSISTDEVSQMLSQAPSGHPCQAVVITSPTYDGIVSDISAIANLAHAHNIPLIVDEAHGAHFGFSDGFPQKALTYGADIVIESIHKTLPAFTQSAALHLADSPYVDEAKIRQYLSIFQTSSPSYILMAGLDQCTRLLKEKGTDLFLEYKKKLTTFYEKAACLKHISVLYVNEHLQNLKTLSEQTDHPIQKDPSKILISADALGITGGELFAVLRDKYHLELEMASLHYVTALTSIMDTQDGFDRLICALEELDQTRDAQPDNRYCENEKRAGSGKRTDISYRKNKPGAHSSDFSAHINVISEQENSSDLQEETNLQIPMCLCEAAELTKNSVPLPSATGKICADFIIPYPPGIPLLVPGEMITEEHVRQIARYLNESITIYGIS